MNQNKQKNPSEQNLKMNQISKINKENNDNMIPDKTISIHLLFHGVESNIDISINKTVNELIKIIKKKIVEDFPKETSNDFHFLYKGDLIRPSYDSLYSFKFQDKDTILILTKKSKKFKKTPLFEENFDIEANIIINNDYDEDINFNLYGLLRVCLLKDICLSINGVDYTYYYDKLPEKIKIYI